MVVQYREGDESWKPDHIDNPGWNILAPKYEEARPQLNWEEGRRKKTSKGNPWNSCFVQGRQYTRAECESNMEQTIWALASILTFISTGATSLQCYQCFINPPPGHYYNTTERLCNHFDQSDKFIVDCPYSTMCMKQDIHLDIQNGVRIKGVLRDCASQKHEFQAYVNGRWEPRVEVLEPYAQGCQQVHKGEKISDTRYCYCRDNLCNTSTSTEGSYTDIMGVIMVFNLMKYINSLR